MRRLVLGAAETADRVVGVLSTWPGDLVAVVPDEHTASEFAALGDVDARVGDPTALSVAPDSVDTVYVAAGVDTRASALAARERYPDAVLVVRRSAGVDGDVEEAADRVVDEREAVADGFLDATTGERARRLRRLRQVLTAVDGTLGVVAHANPDPDAIGAALALVDVARSMGVEAVACYSGEISHQENRALVNLLDLDLRRLEPGDESAFDGIALVDHSRAGVNDGLDPDTEVDVVVDHHPPREPVSAPFVDLRPEVGATSTLLAGYLARYGIDPSPETATALLFGIRVDTREFAREVSDRDFEAAAFLLPHVDVSTLDRVESPSVRHDVLDVLARAIREREIRDDALAACVGRITETDVLAQAADFLLGMAGVDVVIVYGFHDGVVHVSGRARGGTIDLGEAFRDAFGQVGDAGGHADMAGAQISLGLLAEVDERDDEALRDIVDDVIVNRFFETLETAARAPSRATASEIAIEFGLSDAEGADN
ncbi:MAG: bifunctional oligoribonuclease/PAP phosphatase NrnA [Haloferacaceae archaeon]